MSRRFAVAGAIALIAVVAASTESATAGRALCAGARDKPTTDTRRQAADAVLCLINAERARRGMADLRTSTQLAAAAQRHSRDMVTRHYFSHRNLRGEIVTQRAARAGYRSSTGQLGEVLAWGTAEFSSPVELVRQFLASPAHRRIALARRFRDIGVGLSLAAPMAGVGDAATLTVDFGRR